jgi:hypothetical protein
MKVELFKKLIKEAVREAVREELAVVLSEDKTPTKPQTSQVTKYENYKPVVSKPVPTGDPLMEMLQMTRESMTGQEYREMVSANTSMVQAPGLGMNTLTEHSHTAQEPGLDISQFDFIKKAGAVLKASQEKDKQRFGY